MSAISPNIFGVCTVATLPAAAAGNAGQVYLVVDAGIGNPCFVYSDGTKWYWPPKILLLSVNTPAGTVQGNGEALWGTAAKVAGGLIAVGDVLRFEAHALAAASAGGNNRLLRIRQSATAANLIGDAKNLHAGFTAATTAMNINLNKTAFYTSATACTMEATGLGGPTISNNADATTSSMADISADHYYGATLNGAADGNITGYWAKVWLEKQ